MSGLRYVDLSSNDLRSARGLERCTHLQEINLANNDLDDHQSIVRLATACPNLFRINLYYNEFSDSQWRDIVSAFKAARPNCLVVTSKADSKKYYGWPGGLLKRK